MTHNDRSLGAAFIGNVIAACLYGVACHQSFIYFTQKRNDSIPFRILLAVLWVSDTAQLALVTHALYFYMVTNFDQPNQLLYPEWSILSQIFTTCFSGLVVRSFFTWRVWIISRRNAVLTLIIVLTSLATCTFGFSFAIYGFSIGTFNNLEKLSCFLYAGLSCGVTADVLIAASLYYSLSKSRTGFKPTDCLVNILMLYAVNSCLLTSICSIVTLVTFALMPRELAFIGVFFCQSKLHTISLFATLNSRGNLRERTAVRADGTISQPVMSPIKSEPGFIAPNQVMVTIERKTKDDASDSGCDV